MALPQQLQRLTLILWLAPAAGGDPVGGRLVGGWEGWLRFPGTKTPIVLRFRSDRGRLEGRADFPRSQTFGMALGNIQQSAAEVRFELAVTRRSTLRFEGELRGQAIAGKVVGASAAATFSLRRSNAPAPLARLVEPNWTPPRRDDWPTTSWRTSAPEAVGLDSKRLAAAERFVRERLPAVRSLLVVRSGRLVREHYFGGAGRGDLFNVKSVTKSILSALVGIALQRGLLRDIDQPVRELLPEYFTRLADPRKQELALRHLLTMTGGFEWIENGPIAQRWHASDDWVRFTLESKLLDPPGTSFNYSTAMSHLLAVILDRRSGSGTLEFARRQLADPIGMRIADWGTDPAGVPIGGSEVFLTAQDLARFGWLYLNQGRWAGRQVVPAAWVQQSVRAHNAGSPILARYGYQWWVASDAGHACFYAYGYGGQMVYVVPDLDLVVVMTSTIHNAGNDVLSFVSEVLLAGLTVVLAPP